MPADVLEELVGELDQGLGEHWDTGTAPDPGPPPASDGVELEWDRVWSANVDLREQALAARIFGTVWAAAVPTRPGTAGDRVPLWARLVADDTGEVYAEREMAWRADRYAVRGYTPPAARGVLTRIDITTDPGSPPRSRAARQQVLIEQACFRQSFWSRSERRRPFLGERHLRLSDLTRIPSPLLSPGAVVSPPSAP